MSGKPKTKQYDTYMGSHDVKDYFPELDTVKLKPHGMEHINGDFKLVFEDVIYQMPIGIMTYLDNLEAIGFRWSLPDDLQRRLLDGDRFSFTPTSAQSDLPMHAVGYLGKDEDGNFIDTHGGDINMGSGLIEVIPEERMTSSHPEVIKRMHHIIHALLSKAPAPHFEKLPVVPYAPYQHLKRITDHHLAPVIFTDAVLKARRTSTNPETRELLLNFYSSFPAMFSCGDRIIMLHEAPKSFRESGSVDESVLADATLKLKEAGANVDLIQVGEAHYLSFTMDTAKTLLQPSAEDPRYPFLFKAPDNNPSSITNTTELDAVLSLIAGTEVKHTETEQCCTLWTASFNLPSVLPHLVKTGKRQSRAGGNCYQMQLQTHPAKDLGDSQREFSNSLKVMAMEHAGDVVDCFAKVSSGNYTVVFQDTLSSMASTLQAGAGAGSASNVPRSASAFAASMHVAMNPELAEKGCPVS